MKTKKIKDLKIIRARNLVRGAISQLKSTITPKRSNQHWQQEQFAQQQINRALAIARRELTKTELQDFERWINDAVLEHKTSSSQLGTSLTSLGIFSYNLKARDLKTELTIAIDRLERHREELIEFSEAAKTIAEAIELRKWHLASSLLNAATLKWGYSYWAVESELAFRQIIEGVEAAKKHVSTISVGSLGLNKFLVYFFGVRNEPAQTSSRFKISIGKRIDDADLVSSIAEYSKFRLYGSLPQQGSEISKVLACENCGTTIDLLFTTLRCLRTIIGKPSAFSNSELDASRDALRRLSDLIGTLEIHWYSDTAKSGLEDIAVRAIELALVPSSDWPDVDDPISYYVRGIASQLSTRDDGVAAEDLAKLFLNFSWLPRALEIGDTTRILPLPRYFTDAPTDGDEITSPSMAIAAVIKDSGHATLQPKTKELIAALTKGASSVEAEAPAAALKPLHDILTNASNGMVFDLAASVIAHALYKSDQIQECLNVSALCGIANERTIPLLPLPSIFVGVKWPTLSRLGPSIQLTICLDHFLKIVDDRKARTYKRYSIEELIKFHHCKSIADLPSNLIAKGYSTALVEYFFSDACDIFSLELLPGMGRSRKVRVVRAELLRQLSQLHTANEPAYLREADEVEEALQVDDGIEVLDDSKVYVDEQTVLNFANKELEADFQRYLNLVGNGIGVAESLSEVLKGFNKPSAKTFQIPKNDADDLLAAMVGAILHRFLFDPAAGLDIIIGRRIRHGTISGELRGFLEKVELIGHKARTGANYGPPQKVAALTAKMDAKKTRIINASFSRFSESIDHLVGLLRDEYFHVQSPTKERGIFALQLSPPILALARSVAQTCTSISHFSKECIDLFWFMLSFRLTASRPTIEAEVKKSLQTIFGKLVNQLRALGVTDAAFFSELQQASEELQRRATIISTWIRVPKVSVEGKTYAMQRVVDVAVAVVSGQRPGFRPIVNAKVPENLELDTHGFSIVSDALYIAIDNVGQHSGKKQDNRIDVDIAFDATMSLLSFSIISDVASAIKTVEKESRLVEFRADINKRMFGERAREDRHSGLFKLAALVGQSEKTSISFGFIEDKRFYLKFELVYVGLQNSTPSQSADVVWNN